MPTIMELFKNKQLSFPANSTADGMVDPGAKKSKSGYRQNVTNVLQQELSGLRIKSLAEINSPLLYKTETGDIAKRATQDTKLLYEQKHQPAPDEGNAIKLNPKSIIPVTELPTRVVNLNPGLGVHGNRMDFGKNPSNNPITKDAFGKNGTELGKLLKNSGGDAGQLIGGALKAAKDALRGKIFGETSLEQAAAVNSKGKRENIESFSNVVSKTDGTKNNYSKYVLDSKNESEIQKLMGIGYSGKPEDKSAPALFSVPKKDDDKLVIPFWINGVTDEDDKKVFFRATITGLTETSSPSWEGSKFIGNPYEHFIYTGVSRSVAFNLNFYCLNQKELLENWDKLKKLTSKVYPEIKENVMDAPFIKFRLGDMYKNRIGFIESLSYTIPDNSTWEIDTDGLKLPKFIEVAITIKLLESPGAETLLYDYNGDVDFQKFPEPSNVNLEPQKT